MNQRHNHRRERMLPPDFRECLGALPVVFPPLGTTDEMFKETENVATHLL